APPSRRRCFASTPRSIWAALHRGDRADNEGFRPSPLPSICRARLPARHSSGTTQRTIGSTSPLLFRNDGLDATALDSDAAPEAADLPRLSEREVLTLIVKGFSYAEAARLTGSHRTPSRPTCATSTASSRSTRAARRVRGAAARAREARRVTGEGHQSDFPWKPPVSLRFGEGDVALQQGPPPGRGSSPSTGVASGPAGPTP